MWDGMAWHGMWGEARRGDERLEARRSGPDRCGGMREEGNLTGEVIDRAKSAGHVQ